jgi:hypothetical protein
MRLLQKLKDPGWQCFAATVPPILLVVILVALFQLFAPTV